MATLPNSTRRSILQRALISPAILLPGCVEVAAATEQTPHQRLAAAFKEFAAAASAVDPKAVHWTLGTPEDDSLKYRYFLAAYEG